MKPVILGVSGPNLTSEEAALFRRLPPAGVILFGRNVVDPAQLASLMHDLRAVLAPEAVMMVDQEGGRVARLRPPHWRAHPSAGAIARLDTRDPAAALRAAWAHGAAIGAECRAAGFDVVAAPVLDRAIPGQSDVVGDRSFGGDPERVAELGLAMAEGLRAAGVIAVSKHAPGHGRARVDSHLVLPRVPFDAEAWGADLAPFRETATLIPWMMTAHILYEGVDDDRPGTLSPTIIGDAIRGEIGFDGLLLSDDLAMNALEGTPLTRVQASLAAGCDVAVYCPGDLAANTAILEAVPSAPGLPSILAAARTLAASGAQPAKDWGAERDLLLGIG
nr:beta-N-acetylhexosaminidase [Acidisoma sp. L85]